MGKEEDDLTMWEVEEAKLFSLSPNQYCRLRERFVSRKISSLKKEIESDIRKSLEKDLRTALNLEIRKSLQEDLEAKFTIEKRKELKEEVRKDLEKTLLSGNGRKIAKGFLRELELDALVKARAASDMADELALELNSSLFRIFLGISALSAIAICPFLIFRLSIETKIVFLGFIAPFAIIWSLLAAYKTSRTESLEKHLKELRSVVEKLTCLASEVREAQRIGLEGTNSFQDTKTMVTNLRVRLNNITGENYAPIKFSLKKLEQTKDVVRDSFVNDMDPADLYRIEPENEDEFLQAPKALRAV